MMKDLVIYGASGFGREIACLVLKLISIEHKWNFLGFIDDGLEPGTSISHFGKVLGGFETLNNWSKPVDVVIAIASSQILKKLSTTLTNPNINFPNLITPKLIISDPETFKLGKGNILHGTAAFTVNVSLGNFNILNGDTVFGHDVKVGDYNVFMPGVRVSGCVRIGNSNFFGVNSVVLQGLKIGENVKLGAGSVMMTKPKDGNLYIGVPAKKF